VPHAAASKTAIHPTRDDAIEHHQVRESVKREIVSHATQQPTEREENRVVSA